MSTSVPTPASHAKYPHIVRHFTRQIVQGRLAPGQQIPTYDQIAQKFGVSRATIVEAMTQLKESGFLVSGGPRGMFVAEHLPSVRNVGLVLHDDIIDAANHSQFAKHVAQACEDVMAQRPGRMKIYNSLQKDDRNEAYQMLMADLENHRIGNLIFVHTGLELDGTPAMTQPNIARVMVTFDTPLPHVPSVYIDQQNFIDQSLKYLKERGCKRVGLLVGTGNSPDSDDIRQWRQSIEAQGMKTRDDWIQHASYRAPGWVNNLVQAMCRREARERPDGLVITDDHFAPDAAKGLAASNIKVPGDMTVVAYANLPWPTVVDMPFTRLGMDLRMLARHCFEALDKQRRGEKCAPSVRLAAILQQELSA